MNDPISELGDAEKLDLILDVLRTNRLHQQNCDERQVNEANAQGGAYFLPKPCTCWLALTEPTKEAAP